MSTIGYTPQWPVYPCDRGTGTPQGWHHYHVSEGVILCMYCGKKLEYEKPEDEG